MLFEVGGVVGFGVGGVGDDGGDFVVAGLGVAPTLAHDVVVSADEAGASVELVAQAVLAVVGEHRWSGASEAAGPGLVGMDRS